MCPRYNDKCVKVIERKEQKYWSPEIASLTLRASGSTFLRTSTKVAVPQTGMLNLVNMSTIAEVLVTRDCLSNLEGFRI